MNRTNMILSTLIACGLGIATLAAAPAAMAEENATLTLSVDNIETQTGKLMVALFKGQQHWKSNDAIAAQAPLVNGETMTLTFEALEPGEYGIKIYHDENSDGKLNTGSFGIPKEPYGFSNNAPVRFGPPSWEKAHFTLQAGENTQSITLK